MGTSVTRIGTDEAPDREPGDFLAAERVRRRSGGFPPDRRALYRRATSLTVAEFYNPLDPRLRLSDLQLSALSAAADGRPPDVIADLVKVTTPRVVGWLGNRRFMRAVEAERRQPSTYVLQRAVIRQGLEQGNARCREEWIRTQGDQKGDTDDV